MVEDWISRFDGLDPVEAPEAHRQLDLHNRWTNGLTYAWSMERYDMMEALFWGMYSPDWHDKIKKQLTDVGADVEVK